MLRTDYRKVINKFETIFGYSDRPTEWQWEQGRRLISKMKMIVNEFSSALVKAHDGYYFRPVTVINDLRLNNTTETEAIAYLSIALWIRDSAWDGRISNKSKDWAEDMLIGLSVESRNRLYDLIRYSYNRSLHLTLLDAMPKYIDII